jgi:hypothetical protein
MARTITSNGQRHLDVFVPMALFERLEAVRNATPIPASRSDYLRVALLRQIVADEKRLERAAGQRAVRFVRRAAKPAGVPT